VICLCGDIPVSDHIGGFEEGVGFLNKNAGGAWQLQLICKIRNLEK